MSRIRSVKGLVFAITLIAFSGKSSYAAIYTAASCSEADVAAQVTLELATPADGDVVVVPSGSCTWATGLTATWTTNVTLQFSGSTIADNISGSADLIDVTIPAGKVFRLTGGTFQPQTGLSGAGVPFRFQASAGLPTPQVRIDHLTLTGWTSNNISTSFLFYFYNLFGVIDHNTISFSGNEVLDFYMPNYLGVPPIGTQGYGDNSWSTPDAWGSANAIYIENNTFTNNDLNHTASITDCDYDACRFVARYNTIYQSIFGNHGTESGGRGRGGRSMEIYSNTFYATGTYGLLGGWALRSGTALGYNNQFLVQNSSIQTVMFGMALNRNANALGGWGSCDGTGPWDVNDGQTAPDTGHTVNTYSAGTMTANGSPGWTAHEFQVGTGGKLYSFVDLTQTFQGSNVSASCTILDNGTNTLSLGGTCPAIVHNDSFIIQGTTLYASGTATATGTTLTDSAQAWTTNQWVNSGSPYSVRDLTQGFGSEVVSNTATTISLVASNGYGQNNDFSTNDQYAILRATQCIDQDGRGQSANDFAAVLVPVTGSPSLPLLPNDALSPLYTWNNTSATLFTQGVTSPASNRYVADRDYYTEFPNQGAQTSPTSPFDGTSLSVPITSWTLASGNVTFTVASTTGFSVGQTVNVSNTKGIGGYIGGSYTISSLTSTTIVAPNTGSDTGSDNGSPGGTISLPGVGHGTLANRPTTCTPYVAYWATDMNGGNGELFQCTATDIWTPYYTPFAYPHPLVGGTIPNPPTGLKILVVE